MMKRKSPTLHKVRSHKREGKPVRSFVRGSGMSRKNPSKVVKGKGNPSKRIEFCPVCSGAGRVSKLPEDFYEKMHEKGYTHAQFYFPCEECGGAGITNSELLAGKTHIEFIKSAKGIFSGRFEKKMKIAEKRYKDQVGYDVWEEKDGKMKKLTRGRKYLQASNLAGAVKKILAGGEYHGRGSADVISVS